MNQRNWELKARNIFKAEMVKQGLTYRNLAEKLAQKSVTYSEQVLINKINRGKFSFSFFLECMSAIGIDRIYFN